MPVFQDYLRKIHKNYSTYQERKSYLNRNVELNQAPILGFYPMNAINLNLALIPDGEKSNINFSKILTRILLSTHRLKTSAALENTGSGLGRWVFPSMPETLRFCLLI